MKKILAMILAAGLACTFTACGGDTKSPQSGAEAEKEDANQELGRYEGAYCVILGDEYTPMDEIYSKGENYVEIKKGQKIVLCFDGGKTDCTYELDGEKITIHMGIEDLEGTLKDGVLQFDFMGFGDMIFVKDGAVFEVPETEEEEAVAEEADETELPIEEALEEDADSSWEEADDAAEEDEVYGEESDSQEDADTVTVPEEAFGEIAGSLSAGKYIVTAYDVMGTIFTGDDLVDLDITPENTYIEMLDASAAMLCIGGDVTEIELKDGRVSAAGVDFYRYAVPGDDFIQLELMEDFVLSFSKE